MCERETLRWNESHNIKMKSRTKSKHKNTKKITAPNTLKSHQNYLTLTCRPQSMGNSSTTPDDMRTRTRRAVIEERKKKAKRLESKTFILNAIQPAKGRGRERESGGVGVRGVEGRGVRGVKRKGE